MDTENQINETIEETSAGAVTTENAVNAMPEKKGITGSTIKLIAIGTMLIDHTAAVVIDSFLNNKSGRIAVMQSQDLQKIAEWNAKYGWIRTIDMIMRCIGRLAFPLFIFLLIQGFMHTRNKLKYASRLFLFALISEIPFNLALTGHAFSTPFSGITFGYQSVYWTLFAGFLFMCFADFIRTKKIPTPLGALASIVMVAGSGFTLSFGFDGFIDGFISVSSALGEPKDNETLRAEALKVRIVLMVIFAIATLIFFTIYCIKNSYEKGCVLAVSVIGLEVLMLAAYFGNTDYGMWGVLAIAMGYAFRKKNTSSILGSVITLTIMNFIEGFAFIDLIFIKRYNGKRGLSLKYVFYAFYPVHLFLLYTISWLLGFQATGFMGF